MENLNKKDFKTIKQEEKSEVINVLDHPLSAKIIDNVKHEPERHFVFIMPDDPEVEEGKEMKIVLRKFDRKWKDSAKMFKSYFYCDKCDYAAKQSIHLKSHLKNCEIQKCCLKSKSENVEECVFCVLKFDCKNCKTKHINQNHFNGSTWFCSKCDYKTLNRQHLRKHYQTHVKKFSCETCKQKFAVKRELNNHQQNRHHGIFASEPETKFDCENCIRSFPTKPGLRHHERQFHSKLKFHCDICGKTTKTMNEIRQHIQTHFKIPCPICEHLLTEHRLKEHLETHSTTAKFKCDECEKVYFNKNSINKHKKRIHEIDKVQCDLCSKIFKNKLLLRKHITNYLKVLCPICRKPIIKKNLKQHIKVIHSSGEKFLACHIARCRQKLKNSEELKEHEKIHIGTGIYKCPICDHQVKELSHMKTHMKSFHHK